MWIDEPKPDGAKTFATLATTTIKKHMEELEESPEEISCEQQVGKLKEENQTSSLVSFQDVFNIPIDGQTHFLSAFRCPLTHIVPKGEAFRERTKVFHSLFSHHYPLNSLVQLPNQNSLIA